MTTLTARAPAKVNLTLEVRGRRADGYHELLSLVAFASDVFDVVTFTPGVPSDVDITGPFGSIVGGNRHDNTVAKAQRYCLGADPSLTTGAFSIEKNIPVAAGLGGGSADAAAALRLLRQANPKSFQRLVSIEAAALSVGADVPVCLGERSNDVRDLTSPPVEAAWMWGVGESLWRPGLCEFDLIPEALHAVLVNPRVELSTKAVFAKLAARPLAANAPPPELPKGFHSNAALLTHLHASRNDLEGPAVALVPQIATVLDALHAEPGCDLARMSGSGATCFGLFETPASAETAAQRLRAARPGWWIAPTRLG